MDRDESRTPPGSSLRPVGPRTFAATAERGVDGACAVVVAAPDGSPLEGVRVRYRVVEGPALLADGRQELEMATDERGRAAVRVRVADRAVSLIVAELEGAPQAFFRPCGAGTTARLDVTTAGEISALPGVVVAGVTARDHRGLPVSGARLGIEAVQGDEVVATGEVRDLGGGAYEGRVQTHLAGPWTVIVQDLDTRTTGHAELLVTPGPATALRLVGPTDPRAAFPFDAIDLAIRLEDGFGNALDPARIRVEADGEAAETRLEGAHARLTVRATGQPSVRLRLSDGQSATEETVLIPFADAWLEVARTIEVGSRFATAIHALAPAEARVGQPWYVSIGYRPDRARFLGVQPGSARSDVRVTADAGKAAVSLALTATGGEAEGPGSPLCVLEWTCLGDGESCFQASTSTIAERLPVHPGDRPIFEICPAQKLVRIQHICVNVMDRLLSLGGLDNAWHATVARLIEARISGILSRPDALEVCCPVFQAHARLTRLTAQQWAAVTRPLRDETIRSGADFWEVVRAVAAGRTGKREYCINLLLMDIQWQRDELGHRHEVRGRTCVGRVQGTAFGFGVIKPGALRDPGGAVTDPLNILAHEIGHALGVAHAGHVEDDLMFVLPPHGARVTVDDCRTMAAGSSWYPGHRPPGVDPGLPGPAPLPVTAPGPV